MGLIRRARFEIAGLGLLLLLFGTGAAAFAWTGSDPVARTLAAATWVQLPILFFLAVDVCLLRRTRLGLPKAAVVGMLAAIAAWMAATGWAFATRSYPAGEWTQLTTVGAGGLVLLIGFWTQAIKVIRARRLAPADQAGSAHPSP